MADNLFRATQDFHRFAHAYREHCPDDVLTLSQPLSADQDVTAVVAELAARGQHPMLVCEKVDGITTPLVTNFFASRTRIGRLFDVDASGLFDAYQHRANAPIAPVYRSERPRAGSGDRRRGRRSRAIADDPPLRYRPRSVHHECGDRRGRSGHRRGEP